jgi:hypothetical protein
MELAVSLEPLAEFPEDDEFPVFRGAVRPARA